jgi:hypothetical protein
MTFISVTVQFKKTGDTLRRTAKLSRCRIFGSLVFCKYFVKKKIFGKKVMLWHTVWCDCRVTKMCYNFHLPFSAYMGMCN